MMAIRFEGGGLDGRTAQLPGVLPPRGMDVAHDDQVERYGLETSRGGTVTYRFVSKRRSLSSAAPAIPLDRTVSAVPLRFYPQASAGGRRRSAGSSPGP